MNCERACRTKSVPATWIEAEGFKGRSVRVSDVDDGSTANIPVVLRFAQNDNEVADGD